MKKIAIAAIVIGFGFSQVNAQIFIQNIKDHLSGGMKAEANMSQFLVSDMPDTKSKMHIGGTLGGFVKLDLVEHLALQEELLVHYKTSTIEQVGIKSDYQYWGIEIPFYVMGQWKMSKGERFYIGIGPYGEFGISAKYNIQGQKIDLYKKDETTGNAIMKRFMMGYGAIIGYEFSNGIQMNAGYKIGIANALDTGNDKASMSPSTVSFGIGYHF